MKVFYSATAGAIDYVRPDNDKGTYTGKTREELCLEHPDIVIVSESEAVALIEAKYTKPPVEITKEDWWYLLEVLPPCKWGRYLGAEAFHVSERITQSIVTWCVRVGDRYFRLDNTDRLDPKDVIAKVQASLEATE